MRKNDFSAKREGVRDHAVAETGQTAGRLRPPQSRLARPRARPSTNRATSEGRRGRERGEERRMSHESSRATRLRYEGRHHPTMTTTRRDKTVKTAALYDILYRSFCLQLGLALGPWGALTLEAE